jgi:hypothetical protein
MRQFPCRAQKAYSANRHLISAQAVWRQPSHLVPPSKYVFAIHAVYAEIRRTLHPTTIVKLMPISVQSIAHVMLLCPIRTIFELARSQGSDGPATINSPRVLASLPLKIVGGKPHVRKAGGDRVFGGVRIFVDDSHFESDPFAGKKMSGPIREAVERLYRPLICCDVTSALIRHQRVVLLGSCVNERRAFAVTRRVYCAYPGARAAGTTAGDTGHVTSDDTVRDRQRLPSATWGVFSRPRTPMAQVTALTLLSSTRQTRAKPLIPLQNILKDFRKRPDP